jgi:hypothetical protein
MEIRARIGKKNIVKQAFAQRACCIQYSIFGALIVKLASSVKRLGS